jgi:hypothetical protein
MTKSNLCAMMVAILVAVMDSSARSQPVLPDFSAATFSSLQIDNPYFPLVPGTTFAYDGVKTDPDTGEVENEEIIVEVLNQTRTVAGIEARVVRDRVWLEGLLIEDTFDWYAQDDNGHVWYLGENVTDYEYDDDRNLIRTSHPGAWETGVDGALPGYIMEASPQVDDHYYQEFYAGVAEDRARVMGIGEMHTIPLGSFDGILRTRDFTTDVETYGEKFYAPRVGTIMEHDYIAATGMLIGVTTLRSITVVPEPTTFVILAVVSACFCGLRA